MKLIICGSRSVSDSNYKLLRDKLDQIKEKIEYIVSGTAAGADQLGEKYAIENHIQLIKIPANWTKHGKSAGIIRNELMLNFATDVLALWDGESSGTKHMLKIAKNKFGIKHISIIKINEYVKKKLEIKDDL